MLLSMTLYSPHLGEHILMDSSRANIIASVLFLHSVAGSLCRQNISTVFTLILL